MFVGTLFRRNPFREKMKASRCFARQSKSWKHGLAPPKTKSAPVTDHIGETSAFIPYGIVGTLWELSGRAVGHTLEGPCGRKVAWETFDDKIFETLVKVPCYTSQYVLRRTKILARVVISSGA